MDAACPLMGPPHPLYLGLASSFIRIRCADHNEMRLIDVYADENRAINQQFRNELSRRLRTVDLPVCLATGLPCWPHCAIGGSPLMPRRPARPAHDQPLTQFFWPAGYTQVGRLPLSLYPYLRPQLRHANRADGMAWHSTLE